jgi:pimeloyl-ACP methyl ester carboxylesterase
MLLHRLRAAIRRLTAFASTWFSRREVSQQSIRHKVLEIARMLQNEDYQHLHQQSPYTLRWVATETVLRNGFRAVFLTTGPIVHVGEPVISTGWLLTSAKIPIELRRAKLGMSVLLSPSGSILSLRFAPLNQLGLGPSWTTPRYALESSLREVEVQVGPAKNRSRGTLTLPTSHPGPHPCLIMLPGSGPSDQDSSVGCCAKPFKDLALGLATLGVATLRFDKITYTHGGTAKVRNSDTFTLEEEYMGHARDALRQAFQHASVSPTGVFVLGHSLGAYVAPRLMAEDGRIAGCVIMAGPAAPLCWCALRQMRYLASLDNDIGGTGGAEVKEPPQIKDLQRQCELSSDPNLSLSTPRSKLPFGIAAAYWRSFANFTPIETCVREGRPVFVLQGARDYQVTVGDDFARWREGLGGCRFARLKVYERLNHLFVGGEGLPSPREYEELGSVDEVVVRDVCEWVFGGGR